MKERRMKFYHFAIIITSLIFFGSLVGILFNFNYSRNFSDCYRNKVISNNNKIGGTFELINHLDELVNEKEVLIEPSLIYFGYSYCPDICPYDLARNSDVVDILKKQGYDLTPIFISIDPKRDNTSRLRDYIELFHPKMIGLTGSKNQLKDIEKKYKVYKNIPNDENEGYLVDHSTFSYLIHHEKGFLEYYNRSNTSEEISEPIACFLKNIN